MARLPQDIEVYCVLCRARLRWYYGWFCPVRFPYLDTVVSQRKREPWPGEG